MALIARSIVLRGQEGSVLTVSISPDLQWAVTGSAGGTARLWDLTKIGLATAFVTLNGHEQDVTTIAISPDSHWLVTGSVDNTVRIWPLQLDDLIDLACDTAGRNFSKQEWQQYLPDQEYRKTCEQWPLLDE